MELRKQLQKFLKQRKFLLLLLLIALPLTVLLFWSLRARQTSDMNNQLQAQNGFNMALPDASLKDDKPLDKMSYYDKAASDSAKLKELIKNDPYYQQDSLHNGELTDKVIYPKIRFGNNQSPETPKTSPYNGHPTTDPNEAKVYQKLNQLNTALNKAAAVPERKTKDFPAYPTTGDAAVSSADVDRLEGMIHTMNQKDGTDPEMQQLNGMLDKIMNIQHPDLVKEKIRETSEKSKGRVFAVSAKEESDPVSFINNGTVDNTKDSSIIKLASQPNSFYSYDDNQPSTETANAIEAVVHETQTVVNGSVVKLRLTNDVYINGELIPKNNFLFGTAALNGERLNIKINSIRCKNALFPVELSVYDMDGMDGIYIPGAITRDVAKESADRAMQNIGITSLDPSLGAQAASAGIEAAKSLASKKVKLVKVNLKAGYQVLLRDEKQKAVN